LVISLPKTPLRYTVYLWFWPTLPMQYNLTMLSMQSHLTILSMQSNLTMLSMQSNLTMRSMQFHLTMLSMQSHLTAVISGRHARKTNLEVQGLESSCLPSLRLGALPTHPTLFCEACQAGRTAGSPARMCVLCVNVYVCACVCLCVCVCECVCVCAS
jgi:hypothetical protein